MTSSNCCNGPPRAPVPYHHLHRTRGLPPLLRGITIKRVPDQRTDYLHIAEIVAVDDGTHTPVPLRPLFAVPSAGPWIQKYPLANALNGNWEDMAHVDWAGDALMAFRPSGEKPMGATRVRRVRHLMRRRVPPWRRGAAEGKRG